MLRLFDLPVAMAKRPERAIKDLESILRLQAMLLMERNKEKSEGTN